MLRTILNEYLNENIKDKNNVALLFSGGMDSLSILISCLDCGIKPHLYSFTLETIESSDIKKCREISKYYNLQYTEIAIPVSNELLINDVETIIKNFNVYKKTAIQCIHPFIYIFPQIKEYIVLTGLCADDLYGTSKKMAMLSKNRNEFDSRRIKSLVDEKASAYCYIKQLSNNHNKKLFVPYKECKELTSYLLSLSYKEMHSPKQKNCMYESYKDVLLQNKWYRRNENLQCSSKLREYHDSLINQSINIWDYKVVSAIYKKMYEKFKK